MKKAARMEVKAYLDSRLESLRREIAWKRHQINDLVKVQTDRKRQLPILQDLIRQMGE